MASEQYHEYLSSEAWLRKRAERLAISKFRCAACGAKDRLEVHHLTYERIFNENMTDLLPLCWLHHKTAEDLVDKGIIPRYGDVLFLATETIRLICPNQSLNKKKAIIAVDGTEVQVRNCIQAGLLREAWFVNALKEPRKKFKHLIKKRLSSYPNKGRMLTNAFTIYDRMGKQWRSEQTTAVRQPAQG